MFGDTCLAAQPVSFPRLLQDSLLNTMAADFLEDQVMESWLPDRGMVFGSRRCPYTRVVTRPRPPSRQQFVVLPLPPRDAPACCDHSCGKGASGSSKTQDKEHNASPSRKRTASAQTVSGKDAASGTKECVGNSRCSKHTPKTPEKCPWQFSVDMKGCHEVRATTEGGMLMVEGRGSSDTSQQTVRYLTSLPHHVNHDALTATLSNGRLTVTQRAGAQLEGQARTLPIEVQKEASPQPEKQQQQQQPQPNTEVSEEKDKTTSSPDAQEEESCQAKAA